MEGTKKYIAGSMILTALLLSSAATFGMDGHDGDGGKDKKTHTEGEAKSETNKSLATLSACWLTHNKRVLFKTVKDQWFTALESKLQSEDGEFKSKEGDSIPYKKGDYLAKIEGHGWYKASGCIDLSGETTELDPRCSHSTTLNLKDAKEVTKHNKLCAIEWESLRYTVAHRLGILPANVHAESNRVKIETEMNKMWDPNFSFYVRQRAAVMYNQHGQAAHGGDYNGPVNGYNNQIGAKAKVSLGGASENAWPTSFQGKTVDEIAYNTTFSTAAASDGNMMGLNYHPGHAQNVMTSCNTIGVGFSLDINGNATSYFQFTTKFNTK